MSETNIKVGSTTKITNALHFLRRKKPLNFWIYNIAGKKRHKLKGVISRKFLRCHKRCPFFITLKRPDLRFKTFSLFGILAYQKEHNRPVEDRFGPDLVLFIYGSIYCSFIVLFMAYLWPSRKNHLFVRHPTILYPLGGKHL